MTAMAGDLPGYEEASRALYAGEAQRLERLVRAWPHDIQRHTLRWVREAARLERGALAPSQGDGEPGRKRGE